MTLVSRILGSLARLPPATSTAVSVDRDLPAKMNDGVILYADRWHADGPESRHDPLILLRTPYGRRQWAGPIGRLLAERGYQVVIQSCRGTFGSGGQWIPFRNEESDGRDSLEWLAGQPWFSGRLATFGPSYLGLTQWALIENPPVPVEAMALSVTASTFRDAVVYPSECFALGTSLTWLRLLEYQEQTWWRTVRTFRHTRRVLADASMIMPVADADVAAVGRHVPYFQDWLAHEKRGDSWWDPVDFGRQLEAMPPATLVGGWYDIFLPSQVADFQALRAAGRRARLTIGPWSHSSPGAAAATVRDALQWFDGHFGAGPASSDLPPDNVRVFVMGARHWLEFPDWPPPAEEQLWFLEGGGKLQRSRPEDWPPDRYRYDPADPTPGLGGPSLNAQEAGRKDQRDRESRPDVLTFTSEPLNESVTVVGPLSVDLHVRSTREHCDFFVRLCDVSPKGRSTNLSDGIVRLTPTSWNSSEDGSAAVSVPLWPTAAMFKRGHRIRLQVSSGAHPLYIRNTGTGEPLASATALCVADQEIFHDAQHPSCLRLPVPRL